MLGKEATALRPSKGAQAYQFEKISANTVCAYAYMQKAYCE